MPASTARPTIDRPTKGAKTSGKSVTTSISNMRQECSGTEMNLLARSRRSIAAISPARRASSTCCSIGDRPAGRNARFFSINEAWLASGWICGNARRPTSKRPWTRRVVTHRRSPTSEICCSKAADYKRRSITTSGLFPATASTQLPFSIWEWLISGRVGSPKECERYVRRSGWSSVGGLAVDVITGRLGRGDLFEILEKLRERNLFERGPFVNRCGVLALVAKITPRFDAFAAADKSDGEAPAGNLVVDPHRLGIENLDRMRRVVCIEDQDFQVLEVCYFDEADHEHVLG